MGRKAYVDTNADKQFIHAPSDAKTEKTIEYKDMPKSINDEMYSLGFWMYIEDWSYKYQQMKHILNKGGVMNNQPTIYLDKTNNVLKIKLDIKDGICETIDIKNIYMKQWVHIYLNIEDINVNVYINGKLIKSHILSSEIENNKQNMLVNKLGGYNGLITKLLVSNDIKTQKEIQAIYNKGPYSSSVLSLLKDFFKRIFDKMRNMLDRVNK